LAGSRTRGIDMQFEKISPIYPENTRSRAELSKKIFHEKYDELNKIFWRYTGDPAIEPEDKMLTETERALGMLQAEIARVSQEVSSLGRGLTAFIKSEQSCAKLVRKLAARTKSGHKSKETPAT
jgi:hypothetical protein